MSTLLQKANQIKAEKDAKIIPSNIRAGVTIFGVTGTYDGTVQLDLSAGSQIISHVSDLATLLNTALTAEQKEAEISLAQSAASNIITLGNCKYTPDGGATQTDANLGLTIYGGNQLNLSIIDALGTEHFIAEIVTESDISGDWSEPFTISDFIDILDFLAIDYSTKTLTSQLTTGDTGTVNPAFSSIRIHTINDIFTINTSGTTILEGPSE